MRKLDVYNHIYPTAYFEQMLAVAPGFKDIGKRMRNIPMLVDLDERFRVMDRFDDYQQVLSIATPPIEVYAPAAAAARPGPPRERRHGGARLASSGALSGIRRVAAARRSRRRDRRNAPRRSAISAPAASSCSRTSTAGRSTSPSISRCWRRWRSTTCRSGCIRIAAPTSPTTAWNRSRSSRSGGRSAGRTRPASPWRGWCSPASSIAIRT